MKNYESLFGIYKDQSPEIIFCHIQHPSNKETGGIDYDKKFIEIADATMDGRNAWEFNQQRFKERNKGAVPKLKNYLNYTFKRLLSLEKEGSGRFFFFSKNKDSICFNTGLQDKYAVDLVAIFDKNIPKGDKIIQDWRYRKCLPINHKEYKDTFGTCIPEIAWYSKDSRDFFFDLSYTIDKDSFDHLLERAKTRAGLNNASDEAVRNYLRGTIENIIPKIQRNYKVAIPIYYVEEERMQLLLPFPSASNEKEISCFLVERNDKTKNYDLKTIFDLDQAYFSARLIVRPDNEWLNP